MVRQDMVEGLTKKHFKGWPRETTDLILQIVNGLGIKHRFDRGGQHIYLYSLDGKTRPFKAGCHRNATNQVGYLLTWIRDQGLEVPHDRA